MTQKPIRITLWLCLKWTLLVTLSAVASLAAANMTDYQTTTANEAMAVGIVTFIAIYVFVDAWAIANEKIELQKSLRFGVILKIVLELVPAIELLVGYVVVQIVDSLGIRNVFMGTYLKTILMGLVLSVGVGWIAAIYWYFKYEFRAMTRVAVHIAE